jgi:repressor LexA
MTKIHKKFPLKALCRKGFRIRISKSGVKETRNVFISKKKLKIFSNKRLKWWQAHVIIVVRFNLGGLTMYDNLTPRQKEVLLFIQSFYREKGYPPSVREIGKAVGMRSTSTVHGHIKQLEQKGYLRKDPTKPRALELLDPDSVAGRQAMVNVPLVGRITAGQPILAQENIEEVFPLPRHLVGHHEEVFMLSVFGDSMIDAGILDGDYVIVRKQATADHGDIVAALLGDEATVKRFFRETDYIKLQPENPNYAPIYTKDVVILGKVIGVFRLIK